MGRLLIGHQTDRSLHSSPRPFICMRLQPNWLEFTARANSSWIYWAESATCLRPQPFSRPIDYLLISSSIYHSIIERMACSIVLISSWQNCPPDVFISEISDLFHEIQVERCVWQPWTDFPSYFSFRDEWRWTSVGPCTDTKRTIAARFSGHWLGSHTR